MNNELTVISNKYCVAYVNSAKGKITNSRNSEAFVRNSYQILKKCFLDTTDKFQYIGIPVSK